MTDRHTLGTSVVLDEKYQIERVLGAGGFGIIYEAEHIALQRKVAIKEFFPSEIALRGADGEVKPSSAANQILFEHMRLGFLKEARAISQFDHAAITRVLGVFEALGTVYIVMRYEDGPSLKSWLQGLGRLPTQFEINRIVFPLLDALDFIHAKGYLHRDIAPDNILLRPDLSPILIDFGASRPIMMAATSRITGIVKRGYSPPEQYSTDSRAQGPWTDIYALAGTLYQCVTGKAPLDATQRLLDDDMPSAVEAARGSYSDGLLEAIDRGLAIKPRDRPQTIAEWRDMFAPPPVSQILQKEVSASEADALDGSPANGAERNAKSHPPSIGGAPLRSGRLSTGTPTREGERPRTRPASWRSVVVMTVASLLVAAVGTMLYGNLRDSNVQSPPEAPRIPLADLLIDLSRGSFRDCATCPEMAVIPAGTFMMGSPATEAGRQPNEGPQQAITIPRPFAMARHETTRGEWRAFSDATNRQIESDCRALQFRPELIADYEAGRARAEWVATGEYHWGNTNYPQDDTHPVACINYVDAEAYLAWISQRSGARYRLPSEAEWEYAARAGTTTPFSFGNTVTPRDASYHHPSAYPGGQTASWRRGTAPVGSFAANRYGLHDMHGNVWEWVADCPGAILSDLDKTARSYRPSDCDTAVMRGGAFWTSPEWIRSAYRYSYGKTLRGAAAGFRVARELQDHEIRALQPLLNRLEEAAGAQSAR
jgi:formylglycine-generating enzyme required for sulfatase activity